MIIQRKKKQPLFFIRDEANQSMIDIIIGNSLSISSIALSIGIVRPKFMQRKF